MSAIIRANPSFAAGDLVLQAHQTRVAEDGFVQVSMDFACLATALQRQAARFRMEQPPPVPLPADAAALPLESGAVYLNEIESTAEKGIGYLRVLYVGVSLDQKRRFTRAEVARSFSGSASFGFRSVNNQAPQASATFFVPGTISFDYQTEALSARWSSLSPNDKGPTLSPKLVAITNVSTNVVAPVGPGIVRAGTRANFGLKIQSESQAVPVGPVYRFNRTATMVYFAV
jgi:hypothetical protein